MPENAGSSGDSSNPSAVMPLLDTLRGWMSGGTNQSAGRIDVEARFETLTHRGDRDR